MWIWKVDATAVRGQFGPQHISSIFARMSRSHIILVGSDATARIALDVFAALDQMVMGYTKRS